VLADAACWGLGGGWRSARQVEGAALGFFYVFLAYVVLVK
jgi:hypothetical protein